MKYESDGGEYDVIKEWLSTPSFATKLYMYNQIHANFEAT